MVLEDASPGHPGQRQLFSRAYFCDGDRRAALLWAVPSPSPELRTEMT